MWGNGLIDINQEFIYTVKVNAIREILFVDFIVCLINHEINHDETV